MNPLLILHILLTFFHKQFSLGENDDAQFVGLLAPFCFRLHMTLTMGFKVWVVSSLPAPCCRLHTMSSGVISDCPDWKVSHL